MSADLRSPGRSLVERSEAVARVPEPETDMSPMSLAEVGEREEVGEKRVEPVGRELVSPLRLQRPFELVMLVVNLRSRTTTQPVR